MVNIERNLGMLCEIWTFKTSYYSDLFVAALSAVIFVAHAEPYSKTEELCLQILSWQKPIYTFESDYNKNLIKMGARPVNMDNLSLLANFWQQTLISSIGYEEANKKRKEKKVTP
ncbi:MAG: hypothetical protein QME06_06350 [Desulfobacterales bacterium]|nr:hypothetical protein [Desulfobacterales bacterium]